MEKTQEPIEGNVPMKMLICSIGSRKRLATLAYASTFAEALGTQVTLLGVVDKKRKSEQLAQDMAQIARELTDKGIDVSTSLQVDDAEQALRDELERETYDLIAMGALGGKRASRSLLESVAKRVAQTVDSSILFVKGDRSSVSRVLICSSGTERGRLSVWTGAAIACALGAEATLLHVLDEMPTMYAGMEQMEETMSEFLQTNTHLVNEIKWAAQVLKAECRIAEVKVRRGLVPDEILREANRGDYDLLVLGSSRSAGGLVRMMMGDVTAHIIQQAKQPVLVVRPPG